MYRLVQYTSTVHANNFSLVERTIWKGFETQLAFSLSISAQGSLFLLAIHSRSWMYYKQRCIVQVPESRNPVQQLSQPSLNQLLYQVDELVSENTCSRCRGRSKNMAGFLLSGTWTIHVCSAANTS